MRIIPLFHGFPGKTSRGFLGWSSAYLIEQFFAGRNKRYLFDTAGYNERILLLDKLQKCGIRPEEIDGVILSHLHYDHAVNWPLFRKATIYIHPIEMEYAAKLGLDPAVPEFHAEALQRHENLILVRDGDRIDGMEVVETPGHTPGSFSLQIGNEMLVSDAIKNRLELIHGPLGNGWDRRIAVQSIRMIQERAKRVYPGHDVSLVKKGEAWLPVEKAEETIFLHTSNNDSAINVEIQHSSKEVR